MDAEPDTAAAAARLLWTHWQAGTKLAALPPDLRPADRLAGHAVQRELPLVSGRRVVGWKIAATSSAGQAHIGVDGPLAGRLLSGQVFDDGATTSLAGNIMRVVEPEFAFRFGTALAPRAQAYALPEVLDAVATLHPALELPDSRFADFVHAGQAQLIADDACAHQLVLGAAAPDGWRSIDLRSHAVRATISAGAACRLSRDGIGSNVLGDPRLALLWLVNELNALSIGIDAGQFVSTGTCAVPLELLPGDVVDVDYGVLGAIAVRLAADDGAR